jgi:hypothetical protein
MEKIRAFIDSLGGRKTALGLFIIILGTTIDLIFKNHLSTELQNLFVYIFAIYCGGNGLEWLGKSKGASSSNNEK